MDVNTPTLVNDSSNTSQLISAVIDLVQFRWSNIKKKISNDFSFYDLLNKIKKIKFYKPGSSAEDSLSEDSGSEDSGSDSSVSARPGSFRPWWSFFSVCMLTRPAHSSLGWCRRGTLSLFCEWADTIWREMLLFPNSGKNEKYKSIREKEKASEFWKKQTLVGFSKQHNKSWKLFWLEM